ncbi:sterol desaturase family protein [Paraferrimonas sp. SM1919]|uniref:sterol desaturase family protein n=1 Tax=Paraferrimonas sp. SM1919 TaxID=2662263 RepID=UPI0013D64D75|nr:sterol desaturase family protein [Paraferrimonas sp. SM1919]
MELLELLLQQPDLLLTIMAPLFGLFMLFEYLFFERRGKLPANGKYRLVEVICNATLGLMHQVSDVLFGLLIISVYQWLFDWRLFDIEMTIGSFLVLMLLQDFLYYWFHRASHNIRWMWAAHVAHHSSENMNFSTALRQSFMYPIAGMWLFWLPLTILGFPPQWVILVVLINLALQFFVHTQIIKTLGPLELIFNTPSHHRVHHGVNPQYIDKNYAGVLIIWDKLFGSFEPEKETVRYGIPKPINSFNPVKVTIYEWQQMLKEAANSNNKLAVLFGRPKKRD